MKSINKSRKIPIIGAAAVAMMLGAAAPAQAVVKNFFGDITYADPNVFGLTTSSSVSGMFDWDAGLLTGFGLEDIEFNSVELTFGGETVFGDSWLGDTLTFENGDLVGVSMVGVPTSDLDWDFFMDGGSNFEFFSFGWDSGNSVSGQFHFDTVDVPEPSSLILLASGLLGFSYVASRRKKQKTS